MTKPDPWLAVALNVLKPDFKCDKAMADSIVIGLRSNKHKDAIKAVTKLNQMKFK